MERGGKGAGRKSVNGRKEKTHETRVALLAEVTDRGGRLSAGLEVVECEDPEAALNRLEDIFRCSNVEEAWLRSWELLPGVFGRLAERRVEEGVE